MKKVLLCLSLVLMIFGIVVFNSAGAFASEYIHEEDSFFEFLTSSEKNKYSIPVDTWICFNNERETSELIPDEEDGYVNQNHPYYFYGFINGEDIQYQLSIQSFYRVEELNPSEDDHDFIIYFYTIINYFIWDEELGDSTFYDKTFFSSANDENGLMFNNDLDSFSVYVQMYNKNTCLNFCFESEDSIIEYEVDPKVGTIYDLNFDLSFNNTSLMKSYFCYKEGIDAEKIRQEAYNDGHEDGVGQGYDTGYLEGKYEGYDEGYIAGMKVVDNEKFYEKGWIDGMNSVDTDFIYNEGFKAGEASGTTSADKEKYFNDGYDAGFIAGADSVDTNEFYQQGFEAGQEQANDKTFFDYIVEFFKEIGDFFKELFS